MHQDNKIWLNLSDMTEQQNIKEWFESALDDVLDDLYGAALRMAKNHADAQDLVAESVSKAFQSIDKLKDRAAFRGWIFRILSNCFMSDCRKRKTRAETSVSNFEDEDENGDFWLFDKLHQPFLLWWGNPEQQFINELLGAEIQAAIDKLPEAYRIVLVLSEMEGFSYQEMSEILDVPVGTIRSRLSRARSLLQKELWDFAQERNINSPDQSVKNK